MTVLELRLIPSKRTVQPSALEVRFPFVTRQANCKDPRLKVAEVLCAAVVLIARAEVPPKRPWLIVPLLMTLGGEGITKYSAGWFCCVATVKPWK